MNSAWPPKREPWAKITPEQSGSVDLDVGQDLVRAAAHVGGNAFRHRGRARIVDVPFARRLIGGPRQRQLYQRRAIVDGQHVVLLRLFEPGRDQLLNLLGILAGQIPRLRAIRIHVIQLPPVLVEVALVGQRGVDGRGPPTILPDAAGAQHGVVLALLLRRAHPAARRRCSASRRPRADTARRPCRPRASPARRPPGSSGRCRSNGDTGSAPRRVPGCPSASEMTIGSQVPPEYSE